MLALAVAALCSFQSLEDPVHELRAKLAEADRTPRPDGAAAAEAWEKARFDAAWDLGIALLRFAEHRMQPDAWREVVRHYTDFIWRYEDEVAALQARLHLARAHQALQDWGSCFAAFAGARRLETPERRKDEDLVRIATASLIGELRARHEYRRGLETSLRDAELHLRQFAAQAEGEAFVALRIETARALDATGRPADCERTLLDVLTKHEEGPPGDAALEALATLVAKAEHVDRFARRLFERRHFTAAVGWLRRLPRTPAVWLRLGICYTRMRRLYEAAEALRLACLPAGPERVDAAVRLEKVLRYLVNEGGDRTMQPRLDAHRAWMAKNVKAGPGADFVVASGLVDEGKFAEAAALLERDRSGAEALQLLGYCRFKLKEHAKAVEAFQAYLAEPARTPRGSDTAFDLACWSLLAQGKAAETLALTERHVPQDPVQAEGRLAHRVDALARLGRLKEARAAFDAMKESTAPRPTVRALERLAAGYEQELARSGDKALWGPYARLVIALSERTFQPLRGEKLLAAAVLRATERDEVLYRQARAAAGGGLADRALEIAQDLASRNPMNGTHLELQADAHAAKAASLPPGSERNRHLDASIRRYAELASGRALKQDEHYFRLSWKYASRLFARDPEQAHAYFADRERRGYGAWDEDRWGWRTRIAELRRQVLDAVPRCR